MTKNENLILLDLFSGMGGFHLGLHNAGFNFDKVYFSEIDKHAIANYKYNFPNAQHIGSVTDILDSGIERPEIITFGSPCQDFSLAGKRAGMEGSRSSLIEYALSAIDHYRPDVFIWENVKGAFSSNGGRDFIAILQAIANIGLYECEWQLLNTSWVLPQNRERIYLVGHLATKLRSWRGVFPVGESERTSYKKEQSDDNGSKTQISGAITTGYGGRPTDTYIVSKGHGFVKDSLNAICPTIRSSSLPKPKNYEELKKQQELWRQLKEWAQKVDKEEVDDEQPKEKTKKKPEQKELNDQFEIVIRTKNKNLLQRMGAFFFR